jgi:hypothetical protein
VNTTLRNRECALTLERANQHGAARTVVEDPAFTICM